MIAVEISSASGIDFGKNSVSVNVLTRRRRHACAVVVLSDDVRTGEDIHSSHCRCSSDYFLDSHAVAITSISGAAAVSRKARKAIFAVVTESRRAWRRLGDHVAASVITKVTDLIIGRIYGERRHGSASGCDALSGSIAEPVVRLRKPASRVH